jgi:penicillin-binding protein 1A
VAWSVVAVPVLLLLYALVQVFTPNVSTCAERPKEASVLMTSDGRRLAFKRANREWSVWPRFHKVDDALIATEDRRFYQHHGMDLKRAAGAVSDRQGDLQGGSTITQQLAQPVPR